jgi:ubiquinone/menaquinone biosynthesis C-methylase UbiE
MESQRAPLFDEVAKNYPHRISYGEKFFDVVAKRLELNATSRLLDIACGSGQLASGFARYCGEITAIDQSEKMLELARAKVPTNVTLAQFDVNCSGVAGFGVFDVVTIGRALRYLDRASLFAFWIARSKTTGPSSYA